MEGLHACLEVLGFQNYINYGAARLAYFLPKAFGWLGRETGYPQAAFLALLALIVISFVWLNVAIRAERLRELLPQRQPDSVGG